MRNLKTITALILIALTSLGCNAEKVFQKKKEKAATFMLQNKPVLAELCSEEFPVKETEVIEGETIVVVEKEYIPGEIIPCPEPTSDNPKPSVQCPPCEKEYIKTYRVDTIKVRDYAKEYTLENKVRTLTYDNEKVNKELNSTKDKLRETQATLYIILLFVLLVALAAYIFKRTR